MSHRRIIDLLIVRVVVVLHRLRASNRRIDDLKGFSKPLCSLSVDSVDGGSGGVSGSGGLLSTTIAAAAASLDLALLF